MIQDLINNHYYSLNGCEKCVSSVYWVEWIQHVLYWTCVSCDLLLHRFSFSHSFSPLNTHFFVCLTFFSFALKQLLVTFSFCVLGNNILPNLLCLWFGFILMFRCWFWSDSNGDALLISSLWANVISEIELIKKLERCGHPHWSQKECRLSFCEFSKHYETVFYFDYICYTLSFSLCNDTDCISLTI